MMKHLAVTLAALALGAVPAFAASAAAQPMAAATSAPEVSSVSAGAPSAGDRMTDALNLLEAQGYGSFSDFRAEGGVFTATVKNKGGKDVKVQIDPASGQITTQS